MFFLAVGLWMQVAAAQPAANAMSDSTSDSAGQQSAPAGPVLSPEQVKQLKIQIKSQPETLTVGQHFTFTVTVHAPAALAPYIQFPMEPDTDDNSGLITDFLPMKRHDVVQNGFIDATATYSLTAWDVGKVGMSMDDVYVAKTRLRLPNGDSIFIKSVLPKDSVKRAAAQPKLPRGLLAEPPLIKKVIRKLLQKENRPILLIVIIVAVLILALIAFLIWGRKKPKPTVISWDWVEDEFRRVESMHLVEKGEAELHAILMTNVVRHYLTEKFSSIRSSATTRELVNALKSESLIPAEQTLALFERVDLLKFAQDHIQTEAAKAVGTESKTIFHEILEREEAEARAAAAAALEAEQNAAAAKGGNTSGKTPDGRKAA